MNSSDVKAYNIYKEALETGLKQYVQSVVFVSKWEDLSMLAGIYKDNANSIAEAIEDYIYQTDPELKIVGLYLMASIIQKHRHSTNYTEVFEPKIINLFSHVFINVETHNHEALFKLRLTWDKVFSNSTLVDIDSRIREIDQTWPINFSFFTTQPPLDKVSVIGTSLSGNKSVLPSKIKSRPFSTNKSGRSIGLKRYFLNSPNHENEKKSKSDISEEAEYLDYIPLSIRESLYPASEIQPAANKPQISPTQEKDNTLLLPNSTFPFAFPSNPTTKTEPLEQQPLTGNPLLNINAKSESAEFINKAAESPIEQAGLVRSPSESTESQTSDINNNNLFNILIMGVATPDAGLSEDEKIKADKSIVDAIMLKLKIDPKEVDIVHRYNAKPGSKHYPIIRVTFHRIQTVQKALRSGKLLADFRGKDGTRIFINPDLTADQREAEKELIAKRKAMNNALTEDSPYYYGIRNGLLKKIEKCKN